MNQKFDIITLELDIADPQVMASGKQWESYLSSAPELRSSAYTKEESIKLIKKAIKERYLPNRSRYLSFDNIKATVTTITVNELMVEEIMDE